MILPGVNLPHSQRSLTLFELLIAIALLSLMVLGFASIDLFSRHQVLTADRRAQVQNEVSFVLEHMSKQISMAIGDANQIPVNIDTPGGSNPPWRRIRVWIDSNPDGIRDTDDVEIAYEWNRNNNRVRYWPDFTGPNEEISNRVTNFDVSQTDNYVSVELTSCWDPDGTPFACGTSDNPTVTMRTRIRMPSVSTN